MRISLHRHHDNHRSSFIIGLQLAPPTTSPVVALPPRSCSLAPAVSRIAAVPRFILIVRGRRIITVDGMSIRLYPSAAAVVFIALVAVGWRLRRVLCQLLFQMRQKRRRKLFIVVLPELCRSAYVGGGDVAPWSRCAFVGYISREPGTGSFFHSASHRGNEDIFLANSTTVMLTNLVLSRLLVAFLLGIALLSCSWARRYYNRPWTSLTWQYP